MTLEAMRCPDCQAPIRFAAGASVAECGYCGAQVRDRGEATPSPGGGPALAETIAIQGSVAAIPLVPTGTAVPAAIDQLLSTSRDGQDALPVKLLAQRAGHADRTLAELAFPIVQRAPRGVPKLHLRITVAATGVARLALWEAGAENRQLVELGTLAIS